jgi:hypothetical protein
MAGIAFYVRGRQRSFVLLLTQRYLRKSVKRFSSYFKQKAPFRPLFTSRPSKKTAALSSRDRVTVINGKNS